MTTVGMVIVPFYLALVVAAYWWYLTAKDRLLLADVDPGKSRTINSAGCGSLFIPYLDPYVGRGSVVYIPSGDGMYLMRHKRARNEKFKAGLVRWLARGAELHIFITSPSEDCLPYWHAMKARSSGRLHVHLLYRDRVAGAQAEKLRDLITQLDTFHPTIILNENGPEAPGAMWIEAEHPLESKFAFGIQFVVPSDAAHDSRLQKYRMMFVSLLDGPHVETVDEPKFLEAA